MIKTDRLFSTLIWILLPTITLAVINNGGGKTAERREAPLDTYGPPPQISASASSSDGQIPHREYGVPILKYGPPKVQVEYRPSEKFIVGQNSFHEQVKQHFGLPKPVYGVPPVYGPPKQLNIPKPQYGPPSPQKFYGPPPNQSFNKFSHGQHNIQHQQQHQQQQQQQQNHHYHHNQHQQSFGSSGPIYKPSGHVQQHQALPLYRPPNHEFRPPPPQSQKVRPQLPQPQAQYGPPPSLPIGPVTSINGQYGAPSNNLPSTLPKMNCDGWRPIAAPAIPYSNGEYRLNSIEGSSSSISSSAASSASSASFGSNVQIQNSITDNYLHLPISNAVDFHGAGDSGAIRGHPSEFDIVKSEGIELNGNGYNTISIDAPHLLIDSYNNNNNNNNIGGGRGEEERHIGIPKSSLSAPGLIPSSGVYGVPPGGSYAGLAIQHGSISGNLKSYQQQQHHQHNLPPTRPIHFRSPVPQGLIESIGQSVQHLDTFGVKSPHQTPVYIPPPANEIPRIPHHVESHSQQQNIASSITNLNYQALPLTQNGPRFNSDVSSSSSSSSSAISTNNCGQGPNLSDYRQQQQQPAAVYGQPDFVETKSSSSSIINGNSDYFSNYNHQSSSNFGGNIIENQQGLTTSYGPPPSGIPGDSIAYDTQLKSSSISSTADGDEKPAEAQALTSELLSSIGIENQVQSSSNTALISESSEHKNEIVNVENEGNSNSVSGVSISSSISSSSSGQEVDLNENNNLPGLSNTGLDIISAQKSQSLTIPVQGQLGTYQLQFQAANPLGSVSNSDDAPNHQQILSEGLLQSILSAIEQPGSSNAIATIPQSTYEQLQTHTDVDNFIKSQTGQEVLVGEPKIQ